MPRSKKQAASIALVPAAAQARPLDKIVVPTAVQTSVAAFEKAIGGRPALIEALASGAESPDVQAVLRIIADPHYDRWTLARICQKAGITPWQLFSAFKSAAIARAHVLALLEGANRTPQVTKEIFDSAVKHEETCTACNGLGTIVSEPTKKDPNPPPATCLHCNGVGTLWVPGSLEHQKLALDLVGLVKKSGGVQIAVPITNNLPGSQPGGSLEQLQQAVSTILYRSRQSPQPSDEPEPSEPIDVEPLPPEDPAV